MRRKRIVLLSLAALALPLAAFDYVPSVPIGGGMPVVDYGAIAQLVSQVAVATGQLGVANRHFSLSQFQGLFLIAARSGWQTAEPPWKPTVATDRVGLNSGYLAALNYGTSGAFGYQRTVEPLQAPLFANTPLDQQARLAQAYAEQERSDGTITHSVEVIGTARANEPAMRAALARLQQTTLSTDPNNNTEAAQLNAISAAAYIAAQNSMTTNSAVLSTLEHVAHQQALQRQADVQALNDDLFRRQNQQAFMNAQAQGTTIGIASMRIP